MPPKPPRTYEDFVARFPGLAQGWETLGEAARGAGPLTEREIRLVKLGLAVGALREGAVHAAARRALDDGLSAEEIEHVVALAASTIGLPGTVAAWSWVRDAFERFGEA